VANENESLDAFLGKLKGKLGHQVVQSSSAIAPKIDEGLSHATTLAPNAIEWAVSPIYLNVPTLYVHVRQYQIIRDLFQLRCPLPGCNDQSPEAIDCWGKGKDYLESENLLVYNTAAGMDVCPHCLNTRADFEDDGLLDYNNQLHLVCGMRTISLNTHILTSNGLIRIGKLLPDNPEIDRFYPVENLTVYGQNGWEQVSDVYFSGHIESRNIILANGMVHGCSRVHPVYGFNGDTWGWHRAWNNIDKSYVQLVVGDKFVGAANFSSDINDNINNIKYAGYIDYNKPNSWSDSLGAYLGYLVAEGDVSRDDRIRFTNGDAQTLDHFRKLGIELYKFDSGPAIQRSHHSRPFDIVVSHAGIRRHLLALGLEESTAHTKTVPESIWSAPESAVCAFLRAYFEGDGTASVEKVKYRKNNKPVVACYTVSRQLALDIQQLLWNLGMDVSITSTKSREYGTGGAKFSHDAYSIRLYGCNILKFAEKIGFYSDRKKAELQKCVDIVRSSKMQYHRIPGLTNIVKSITSRVKLPAKLCTEIASVKSGRYDSMEWPLLDRLVRYLETTSENASEEFKLLKYLSNPDFRFVKIKSIENGPSVPMADLHVPGTHSYVANSIMNHNSGKTAVAATIGTYIEHFATVMGHRLNGLDSYFKQLPGQVFDITFVASTEVQSKDTIWSKFTELRRHSQWFTKYIRWIKQKQIEQQVPNGVRALEYRELDQRIENDFIKLKLVSMNSNSGGMAGRTRISGFIDELARFDSSDSSHGADEVYRVLDNSLATVRGAVANHGLPRWLGLMAAISSPISIEDKSMTLLKQCPSIPHMYWGHYPTWLFNPELSRESFEPAFQRDPIGAMRDYGAQPPSAASPLIPDPVTFRQLAIQPDLRPTSEFRSVVHADRIGREYISVITENAQLCRTGERFICYDAGAAFDQFAGACAHGEWVTTPEGRQLITVYDWVVRILPEIKPRRDVWFDFVVQSIEYLSKYYHISRIEFDRWQSTYLIQQIRDRGIMAEMQGTTYEQFVKFVSDVNYSRVRMLPPAPNDALLDPPVMSAAGLAFYELERLERDTDLKKVHNPRKGQRRGWNSDDVATVVVHVNDMVQSTVVDIDDSTSRKARLHREQMGGAGWGGRGSIYRPTISKRNW
jgi:hypothetical protein